MSTRATIIGKTVFKISLSHKPTFRGFDLANHFVEYSIRYDLEHPPYYKVMDDKFPDRTKMLQFLTDYLTEIMPNASERELNSEADKLLNETMQFVPVSYFFWAVWAFLQAVTSPLEFGFAVGF